MKHTKGPWKYSPPQGAFGHEVVAGSELICQMNHHPRKQKQAKINAEFIVKACNSHYELLEACKAVIKYHRKNDSGEGELFGLDIVTTCISAVRNATDNDFSFLLP